MTGRPGPALAPVTPMLTTTELAQVLRVHPRTLARWARTRQVPAYRLGHGWRFDIREVTEMLPVMGTKPTQDLLAAVLADKPDPFAR